MFTRRSLVCAGLGIPMLRTVLQASAACGSAECGPDDHIWLTGAIAALPPDPPPNTKIVQFAADAQDTGPNAQPLRPLWSWLLAKGNGDALTAYQQTFSAAYTKMQALPPTDQCSPTYQAWLHWVQCPGTEGSNDIHSNSGFLPWHRAYLYYFERLIQTLSQNLNFRLAVWDWENHPEVPSFYNVPALLPKFDSGCTYCRGGINIVVPPDTLTAWLQSPPAQSTTFIGKPPSDDPTATTQGTAAGDYPHGYVHDNSGWLMGDLSVAAFDPIFFAHHANIDRLWDYWCQFYRNNKDYADFFSYQQFPAGPWIFYDTKTKQYVSVKATDMLQLDGLGYSYSPPTNVKLFSSAALPGTLAGGNFTFPELETMPTPVLGDRLKTGTFSLPVTVKLAVPQGTKPGAYTLLLTVGKRKVTLGHFSISGHRHSMGAVRVFGSIMRADLDAILNTDAPRVTIKCKPSIRSLKVASFELQYPASQKDWRSFLSK
jgi:hypothetical protein